MFLSKIPECSGSEAPSRGAWPASQGGATSRGGCGALEGSLEEVASCGWRRVETPCDEQRKTREGFLLEYMNPEFPSHLRTTAGNQVSYKVGSWKYP